MDVLSLKLAKDKQNGKLDAPQKNNSLGKEVSLLSESHCVFDSSEHENAQGCLAYMAKEFGFVVPKVANLQDVEGFLAYLGQKVGVRHACLCCDFSFDSIAEVQKHMKDNAHYRVTTDDGSIIEEYVDFYRFESEQRTDENGTKVASGEENTVEGGFNSKCNPDTFSSETRDGKEEEEVEKDAKQSSLARCLGRDRKATMSDKASESVGDKASSAVRMQAKALARKQAKTMVRKQATNVVRRHGVKVAGRAAIGVAGGPAVAAVGGTILTVMTAKAVYDASGKAIDAIKEARAEDPETSTEDVKA